jgi:mono/diheme cytochrome c family protein
MAAGAGTLALAASVRSMGASTSRVGGRVMARASRGGPVPALRIALVAVPLLWARGGAGETDATGDTTTASATTVTQTGEQLFQRCVNCHQANGQGVAGTYPPLAGSEFVNAANAEVPILVMLFGMQGPVTVNGARYDAAKPPYGTGAQMSDAEVAAVLTYVRRSWGNTGAAVTAEQVAKVRAANAGSGLVTEEMLRKLM